MINRGNEVVVPEDKKVVATFTTWLGNTVEYEIETEYIWDIVDAVRGQFTFIDNAKGFGVKGQQFANVDIRFMDSDYVLVNELEGGDENTENT